jgi:4-amino-4-deoxy-L-arabinose transferase-like glycosyltransferase
MMEIYNRLKTDKILVLLSFLILLRFALSLYYPVYSDACQYFYAAKKVVADPSWLIDPEIYYYPPLMYLLGAPLSLLGELGLKLISPFFGGVAIFYSYRLGKEIYNERIGIFAGIFLGFLPSHLYLSSMGYADAMVTGLLTAFVYYFHRVMKHGNGVFIAGVLAGLAGLSKHTGIIFLPFMIVFLVIFLLSEKRINIEILKKCILILLIAILICGPYYSRNYFLFGDPLFPKTQHETIFLIKGWQEESNVDYPKSQYQVYRGPSIVGYTKEVYLDFWGIPHGNLERISFLPFYIIAGYLSIAFLLTLVYVYGFLHAMRERKKSMVVLIWLLTWFLMILLLGGQLLFGYRRILPTAPFLAICGGYGFFLLEKLKVKRLLYLFLIIAIIGVCASQVGKAWYGKNYFDQRAEALEYLKNIPDAVVASPDADLVIYYTEKTVFHLPPLSLENFTIKTLKKYNITHVVRSEYLWYDVTEYNEIMEEMEKDGLLKRVFESEHVIIYKV